MRVWFSGKMLPSQGRDCGFDSHHPLKKCEFSLSYFGNLCYNIGHLIIMSDKEKARVIPQSELPKRPKVTVVPSEDRKVRVWVPKIGDVSLQGASDFVARYREYANLASTHGFMSGDLDRMVQASQGAPLRFVYELRARTPEGNVGHWMLFLRSTADRVRVYDPVVGVRDLMQQEGVHRFHDVMFNHPNTQAKWGPERVEQRGSVRVTHHDLLNPRSEREYQLDENILAQVGPLQRTDYDCGPLAVYAGLVARKGSRG